jgi:hypothetical protein
MLKPEQSAAMRRLGCGGFGAQIRLCRTAWNSRNLGVGQVRPTEIFLTTPFCIGGPDFVALYLFDHDGDLLEARIEQLGARSDPRLPGNMKRHDARDQQLLARTLADLGPVSFESIAVKPFAVERNGVIFGLIVQEPEEEDEPWSVIAEPGNYMAFFPPWDGDYDT